MLSVWASCLTAAFNKRFFAGSWDHLAPLFKPPPRADAKPIPAIPKQKSHIHAVNVEQTSLNPKAIVSAGSWDHLAPLFKPPPRADAKPIPMDPPNEAAAADVLFAAVQNKRYKHTKGVSYKGATFALVPLDRKVCQMVYAPDVDSMP